MAGTDEKSAHARPDDALAKLPGPEGERSSPVFEHGTLVAKIYAPRGEDRQQPHERDEVYFVIRGSGRFYDGSARREFGPGDLLFVEAGREHRFEDFTDDLAVWVVFYGPKGGEAAAASTGAGRGSPIG